MRNEASASFGGWVRERRMALDLTQADLARRVACAVITIRKIEADERRPSKVMTTRLAEGLEIEESERDRFAAVARSFLSPMRLPSAVDGVTVSSSRGADPTPLPGADAVPAPLHRLIGRDDDLERLSGWLVPAGGPARLVTITGAPGVGKTRVAIELARRMAAAFDLAVVYVELATADDTDAFQERLASAVAVSGPSGADRYSLATAALGRVPTLLVLDNFEQLVDCAPAVGVLLHHAPDLLCVVTSRVRLDIYGEHEYVLAPLAVPSESSALGLVDVEAWPAPALFIERAGAAHASLDLTDGDAAAVVRICHRLDGLPLAIELAARRVRTMGVCELAASLDHGLGALGTGGRDVDDRHRTMTGAVEWSYALLSSELQRLLRALAVTQASFGHEAASALSGLPVEAVSSQLVELVDNGLLRRSGGRYAMYEVVRAVAAARLEDLGEATTVRRRHAEHQLRSLAAVAPECLGDEDLAALAHIDREYEDLRAALEWAFTTGNSALGRRIVVLLTGYWYSRCLWGEGARWARLAYDSTDDPVERAWPAAARATMSWMDEPLAAQAFFEEAERGARAGGDSLLLAQVVGGKGLHAMLRGDLDAAHSFLDESKAHFRAAGSAVGEALTELRLGRLAGIAGKPEEFARHAASAAGLAAALGRDFTLGIARGDQSEAALLSGDVDGAKHLALEGFTRLAGLGVDWYAAGALTCVVNVLASAGALEPAANLCGMIEGWLEDLEAPMLPTWGPAYGRHRARLAADLVGEFDRLLAEGKVLPRTVEQVLTLADADPPGQRID